MKMVKCLIILFLFVGCNSEMTESQPSKSYRDWVIVDTVDILGTFDDADLYYINAVGDTVIVEIIHGDTITLPVRIVKPDYSNNRTMTVLYFSEYKKTKQLAGGGGGIEPLQTQEGDY